jgi:hypothetical protein
MAMKSLTSREQIFIFQTLETAQIKISAAKEAVELMVKLDNNIQETLKREEKAKNA